MKLALFSLFVLCTLTARIEEPLDIVGIFTALKKFGVSTFNDIIPHSLYRYSTVVKIWSGSNEEGASSSTYNVAVYPVPDSKITYLGWIEDITFPNGTIVPGYGSSTQNPPPVFSLQQNPDTGKITQIKLSKDFSIDIRNFVYGLTSQFTPSIINPSTYSFTKEPTSQANNINSGEQSYNYILKRTKKDTSISSDGELSQDIKIGPDGVLVSYHAEYYFTLKNSEGVSLLDSKRTGRFQKIETNVVLDVKLKQIVQADQTVVDGVIAALSGKSFQIYTVNQLRSQINGEYKASAYERAKESRAELDNENVADLPNSPGWDQTALQKVVIDDEKTIASLQIFNRPIKIGIAQRISLQATLPYDQNSLKTTLDKWINNYWLELISNTQITQDNLDFDSFYAFVTNNPLFATWTDDQRTALLLRYQNANMKIILPTETVVTNDAIEIVLLSSREVIELPQYVGPSDQGGISGNNKGVWTSSIFVPLPQPVSWIRQEININIGHSAQNDIRSEKIDELKFNVKNRLNLELEANIQAVTHANSASSTATVKGSLVNLVAEHNTEVQKGIATAPKAKVTLETTINPHSYEITTENDSREVGQDNIVSIRSTYAPAA